MIRDEPQALTVVSITPDDLMILARRLQLRAETAYPGQKIFIKLRPEMDIVLKYDPKITSYEVSNRTKKPLPGTEVSTLLDHSIRETVREEEVRQTPEH